MKNTTWILIALVMLAGCSESDTASEAQVSAPEAGISGIDLEYMDTSIRPGDDFFAYVNGTWLKETEIPADKAVYGAFGMLADKSQADVRAIIEGAAAGGHPEGSDLQKVGDLYTSYIDMETRDKIGVAPLHALWDEIDQIQTRDDLAAYFAVANRRGYTAPFSLGQLIDFKNPDAYLMTTWQSGLGLPEREYYLKDDEKSQVLLAQYRDHVETMLALAEHASPAAAAELVLALEGRFAEQHLRKEEAREWTKRYKLMNQAELAELMPAFSWTRYLSEAGLSEIDHIMMPMIDYLQALDGIIVDTSLDDWKTWLKWAALNDTAGRLNQALYDQHFSFFGTVLSGRETPRPAWRRGVSTVDRAVGEVVGKIYVEQHFPAEAKTRMEGLVANLIRAYEKSIRELDWMSEPTRVEALDKLASFTTKIGYPDEWRDYSALQIKRDDLFGNLQRVAMTNYDRDLARHGEPVDRGEWGMSPQTVNAYYRPTLNEIVFPAAILQPPFFNLQADDAVNYGAIGAVIGHEIGHGFDDQGSQFDGKGMLRNWWTDQDREEFTRRTSNLVDQYNAFHPFEDLSLNGEYTLGENIGDLGGISIGLLAYKLSLEGEPAPVIDGFTGVQRVFLGFGQVWRSKSREESIRQQVATGVHSPAKYRTNGPVRNVPEFYEAFSVAPEDALYLAPEDRVKIW